MTKIDCLKTLNRTILAVVLTIGAVACTDKDLPRHQKVVDEELTNTRVEPQSERDDVVPQYGPDHLQIQDLIQSDSSDSWILALERLESALFGPGSKDKSQYGSRPYAGYLSLYRDLFSKFKTSNVQIFTDQFEESLVLFRDRFITPCIDESINTCTYLRESLPHASSLIDIVIYFIENETDAEKKLKLIGVAYEVGNRRQKDSLSQLYIETFFSMVDQNMDIPEKARHSHNVIAAFQLMDWQNPSEFQQRYFVRIAPWQQASADSSLVDRDLKNFLTPYISIYANENAEIRESFDSFARTYWQQLIDSKKDLSGYPAYQDIDISKMFDIAPWEYHVLFSVYFKEMSITQANSLIRSFPNKQESLDRLIDYSKVLIRWDLAIMAVNTNEKIANFYNSQATKSAQHVKASKDYANTLRPDWVEFHTGRVEALQNLLEAQSTALSSRQINEIAEFFSSIDRNVMKTVIYPNMMAFMYEMVRSEWKDKLLGVFDVNADLIVELFFAGAYRGLWFDFLKSEDGLGAGALKNKVSLFRHEIVDSFYYFFAGNVHEAYGFDPDDFVLTLFKDLVIEREILISTVQEMQRDLYHSPDSLSRRWARWCEGVKTNQKQPELIRYFDLDKYLLGYSKDFFEDRKISDRFYTNFFFNDEFRSSQFDSIMIDQADFTHTTPLTVTARIRQEVLPIMGYFGQVVGAYKKLQRQNPGFSRANLQSTERYFETVESRVRSYLGQQAYYGKIFDDCMYVSVNESRRRAKAIVLSEKQYFMNAVHPLLKAVYQSELTVDEANDILFEVNGRSPHYDSRIVKSESGDQVFYKFTKQSYMNRVRRYLTTGLRYTQNDAIDLDIAAVVGRSLTIQMPIDALNSPDFPYREAPDSVVHYLPDMTASAMALEAVAQASDQFSFSPKREIYTAWDKEEVIHYTTNVENLESYEKGRLDHLVQRYFFNGYKIANYEKSECQQLNRSLTEDCLIEEKVELNDLARAMHQSFNMVEIDQGEQTYLEAIKETDFLHKQNMGIQLLFDTGLGERQSKAFAVMNETEKPIPFSRLKGFLDLPLEMVTAPYLGRNFINDYYVSLNTHASSRNLVRPAVSTSYDRDGDFWKTYFFRAQEFFEARTRRGLFLFKFDKEILDQQFVQAKKDLNLQLDGANALYDNAEALFLNYYPENPAQIKVSLQDDLFEFKPLTQSVYQFQNEMNQFQINTERFYQRQQQNWDPYFLQQ